MRRMRGVRGRREWVLDALLWAVLTTPIAFNQASGGRPATLALVLVATAVAVGLSRTQPLVSLLVVVLGSLVDGNFAFAIPAMSYLVGRRAAATRPVVAVFAVIAVGGTLFNLGVLRTAPSQWLLLATILIGGGVFPWLVGRYRAQQVELATAGWERAERLERERQMVALRERARIAQDMHDSLGHELSLIALRAAALSTVLPEPHRSAAADVRRSAADATDRLHDIIGVLREAGEPAPVAAPDVDDLVERARDSGVAVTVERTGPVTATPPMVGRAVDRIVQEALTNATRHAPGAPVRITIAGAGDATTVTVTNGAPATENAPTGRAGTGLVGLRERVRVAGGTFAAEPHQGGFRVRARLPHRAGPAADGDETPVAAELRQARRRARRSLVVAVAAPAGIAAVLAAGYYPFVAADSTLPAREYQRIPLGAARADLAGVLPRRQVPERPVTGVPEAPPGAVCEFYTDGNFPLARATFRLCFADGHLVRKDELR